MRSGRYVVLGLASPRADWFPRVSQWANSAAVPIEFVKCVSGDELRTRLAGGRPFSAMLLDAAVPTVDRDLLAAAAEWRCPAIVVEEPRAARDWVALGASATLARDFDRAALLDALLSCSRPLTVADMTIAPPPGEEPALPWRGVLIAVTGPGGTGASTTAIGLAQGLAADVRNGRSVLLADLCLRADHAMLHDTRDVAPGVQELVEAHRAAAPSAAEIAALTFEVPERGYHLLLGLRRARFWTVVRPVAFRAGLRSLLTTYRVVVADIDAELEGEQESGSVDVEERNVMARSVVALADAVVVVGEASMKGLHALARVVADVHEHGVDPARVIPAFTRAPRAPRQRAVFSSALAAIAPGAAPGPSPLFLPARPTDALLQVGARLPRSLTDPLVSAVHAVLGRSGARPVPAPAPLERVRPGSLGRFSDGEHGVAG